jgi:hypothetical protein
MSSQERLRNALSHKETPVPIDLGSTGVTGMHSSVVEKLRKHYGLEERPVKIHEPYQMLGLIEEDLKEALGVDVDGVYPAGTLFGFPAEDWKEWRAPWGQELLVPGKFNVTYDEKGACYLYPEGDTTVPPSGKMPVGGLFFDAIIRQPPVDDDNLDPEDNLEEFGPITDEEIGYFRRFFDEIEPHRRGKIANFGGTGVGDIALVPAINLKHPKGIRDVEEWYVSTVIRQDYLHEVFDRQTDIAVENLARLFEVVGNRPDVAFICGTDFGTQDSTFCSAETFDTLYKPYYKKVNDWIHGNTNWKTFKHTDGAVFDFIPHFLDAGFDILNPIQISSPGMEPRRLKAQFGDHLVFWGAGVDSQHTLPFGTPEEVRAEVLEHCEIFAPGGGYVFNTIHNTQAGTPVENVVAMIDAIHEFNGEQ